MIEFKEAGKINIIKTAREHVFNIIYNNKNIK